MKRFEEFVTERNAYEEKIKDINKVLVPYLEDLLKGIGWVDIVPQSEKGTISVTHRFSENYEEENTLEGWKKLLENRIEMIDRVKKFLINYEIGYRLSHPGEDSSIIIPYINRVGNPKFDDFIKSLKGIDKYNL